MLIPPPAMSLWGFLCLTNYSFYVLLAHHPHAVSVSSSLFQVTLHFPTLSFLSLHAPSQSHTHTHAHTPLPVMTGCVLLCVCG